MVQLCMFMDDGLSGACRALCGRKVTDDRIALVSHYGVVRNWVS